MDTRKKKRKGGENGGIRNVHGRASKGEVECGGFAPIRV